MITYVDFSSKNIKAGNNIVLNVDARYPIIIEIYCFVTYPEPPKFIPCPDSGKHTLLNKRPFNFKTELKTFVNDGYIEFQIIDADGDYAKYTIEVEGMTSHVLVEEES